MSRPLDGKCALITGSTQGIGRVIAERLAAAGCDIVLTGFGPIDEIAALRARLADSHGIHAIYSSMDLAKPVQIAGTVRDVVDVLGAIDILVNNAVVRHAAPIESFSAEAWDESIAVNLSGAFHAIQAVLPGMRARRWGRIVNMSSIYGLRGAANRVGYVTTKTALIGLTRAVALETTGDGITCNAVCPGTTDTPIHEAAIGDLISSEGLSPAQAERAILAGKQPTGRLISPGGIAALVEFLCGPEAADITGAVLPVDGAWSAS